MTDNLLNSTILITGGTGSFGNAFTKRLLSNRNFKGTIRILSRNESKQLAFRQQFNNHPALRFLIGDIRDLERILMAMRGIDIVIHAAAMRQISALEYNPFEAISTNIIGTQHVIKAAIETGVKKAVFLSSGEACEPNSLGGATKLTAEKLFIQSNFYSNRQPNLSVVRMPNPIDNFDNYLYNLKQQKAMGTIRAPGKEITRFWLTSEEGARFVTEVIDKMTGGEIFVPKIPSVRISDLAAAIAQDHPVNYVSNSSTEPSEQLINPRESSQVTELENYYLLWPKSEFWSHQRQTGKKLPAFKEYNSHDNRFLSKTQIIEFLK